MNTVSYILTSKKVRVTGSDLNINSVLDAITSAQLNSLSACAIGDENELTITDTCFNGLPVLHKSWLSFISMTKEFRDKTS